MFYVDKRNYINTFLNLKGIKIIMKILITGVGGPTPRSFAIALKSPDKNGTICLARDMSCYLTILDFLNSKYNGYNCGDI